MLARIATLVTLLAPPLLACPAPACPVLATGAQKPAEAPVRGRVQDSATGAGVFGIEITLYLWKGTDVVGRGSDDLLRSESVVTELDGRFASTAAYPADRVSLAVFDPATDRALGNFRPGGAALSDWRVEVEVGPTLFVRPVGSPSPERADCRLRFVDEGPGTRRVWPWRPLRDGPAAWARYGREEARLDALQTRFVELETRGLAGRGRVPLGDLGQSPDRALEVEVLPLGSVRGSLQLDAGADATEVRIALVPALERGCTEHWRLTRPDATGAFEIAGVDPGRYALRVGLYGSQRQVALELEAAPFELPPLDLRSGPDGPEAGEPTTLELPSTDLPTTFLALKADGLPTRLFLAGDGPGREVLLPGLGAGPYELVVDDVLGGRWEPVQLEAGRRLLLTRAAPEFAPTAPLVQGPAGKLLRGSLAQVSGARAWWVAARPAKHFLGAAGPVELALGAPGHRPVFLDFAPGDRPAVELRPGWGVRLHVRDARAFTDPDDWSAYALSRFAAAPLEGARVSLDGQTGPTTDVHGVARLESDSRPARIDVTLEGWTVSANPVFRCGQVDELAFDVVVWMVPE